MDVLSNFIVVVIHNIYVSQIMLHALNLHNVIGQLCLNKAGKKFKVT